MSTSHFLRSLALAALVGTTLAGAAWAQRNSNQSDRNANQSDRRAHQANYQSSSGDKSSDADRGIARMLGNLNEAESDLAEFAEGRAQIDAVNRFARKQAREHDQFVKELRQFASDAGSGIGQSDDNNQSSGDNSRSTRSNEFNWHQVAREMANENLRAAKKELRQRSGLDFDWGFVSQQKMIHDVLCADIKVLRQYASSSLREVLDDQLASVKQDQQTLENLIGRLKDEEHRQQSQSGNSSDRRSDQPNRSASYGGEAGGGYLEAFQFGATEFNTSARLSRSANGRASLGVRLDQRGDGGAVVSEVRPGGPAEQAGLQPGDVIVVADGRDINTQQDLVNQISQLEPGDAVSLTVYRSSVSEQRIPLGRGNQDQGRAAGQRSSYPRDSRPDNYDRPMRGERD